MRIIVYSAPTCSFCQELKEALDARALVWDELDPEVKATLEASGHVWEELDIREPESLTILRTEGVFTLSAPVLQIDTEFYTVDELWDGGKLRDLGELGL